MVTADPEPSIGLFEGFGFERDLVVPAPRRLAAARVPAPPIL
jgi:hypothetical protein